MCIRLKKSVLWLDNYLFCSCDENYDKIKKEQLTGPKIYRINNGHIDKDICMLDTALNLVACNHSNVFIAITEFEVLVIDTGRFLEVLPVEHNSSVILTDSF